MKSHEKEALLTYLEFLLMKQNEGKISLTVHPFLYAYFTAGIFSPRVKWWLKYHRWVTLEKDSSLGITDFVFRNGTGEEIELV